MFTLWSSVTFLTLVPTREILESYNQTYVLLNKLSYPGRMLSLKLWHSTWESSANGPEIGINSSGMWIAFPSGDSKQPLAGWSKHTPNLIKRQAMAIQAWVGVV